MWHDGFILLETLTALLRTEYIMALRGDVATNNIANVSTEGFARLAFSANARDFTTASEMQHTLLDLIA